jgi:hypothetical protein
LLTSGNESVRKGLNLVKFPSGRWSFAGRVPTLLGYENAEDTTIAEALCHCGIGIAAKIAERRGLPTPKVRAWPTREAVIAEAMANGFHVEG